MVKTPQYDNRLPVGQIFKAGEEAKKADYLSGDGGQIIQSPNNMMEVDVSMEYTAAAAGTGTQR